MSQLNDNEIASTIPSDSSQDDKEIYSDCHKTTPNTSKVSIDNHEIDCYKATANKKNDVEKKYKGAIIKYYNLRHFGFIKIMNPEQGVKKEIFFHKSNISKSNFNPIIKVGDKCEFTIEPGMKGDVATNITIKYRPIPKLQKQTNQNNNDNNENNLRAELFTKTMLEFFKMASSSTK